MTADEARDIRKRIVDAIRPEWVARGGRCSDDWAAAPCPMSARLYWKASAISRGAFRKLNADRLARWPGYERDASGAPIAHERERARMLEAQALLENAQRALVSERPAGMRLNRKGRWVSADDRVAGR